MSTHNPPRRGSSNEYPLSMFLSRNKKNNVYPCKPQFYYIKVGFQGEILYRHVFVMPASQYDLNNDINTKSSSLSFYQYLVFYVVFICLKIMSTNKISKCFQETFCMECQAMFYA